MKIDYCKGNAYFDTYYVRDENGNEIGLLEDHCRGVKQEYFVGWKKLAEARPFDKWETKACDTKEEALDYIIK